jgi:hypothetical protein
MGISVTLFKNKKKEDEQSDLAFTTGALPVVKLVKEWIGTDSGELMIMPDEGGKYVKDLEKLFSESIKSENDDLQDQINILYSITNMHYHLRTIGPKNIHFSHYHINLS